MSVHLLAQQVRFCAFWSRHCILDRVHQEIDYSTDKAGLRHPLSLNEMNIEMSTCPSSHVGEEGGGGGDRQVS